MIRFLLPIILLGMPLAAEGPDKGDHPNVLLILVDDLKPVGGCYGQDWVQTPNIDRLASRGVRFDAAYCNQAVCAPSRNNLMTGCRSTTLGVYDLKVNFRAAIPEAVTLPQYFRRYGYHASGVGKVYHIGHGNTDDSESWSEPFYPEKVIDYVLPESTNGLLTREEAYFSNQKLDQILELPQGAAWERADVEDSAYADGRIAEEGIKRLRAAKDKSKPFFLALGFVKPHLPFCAPEKYWALYDDVEMPIASQRTLPFGAPGFAGKNNLGEIRHYKPMPVHPPIDPNIERTLVHGYFAAVSYVDAQIGKVLDELDRLGLDENTVIVLWGDHGFHLGDHGLWTKHTNYEQATRIPVIISGPGVTESGTSSDTVIETVDLYPTLIKLAGLPMAEVPQGLDGSNLSPVLMGNAGQKNHAYHAFPRGKRLGRAIRTERYRLVEWKSTDTKEVPIYELYDYEVDPMETKNWVNELPEVKAELIRILSEHPEPNHFKLKNKSK